MFNISNFRGVYGVRSKCFKIGGCPHVLHKSKIIKWNIINGNNSWPRRRWPSKPLMNKDPKEKKGGKKINFRPSENEYIYNMND